MVASAQNAGEGKTFSSGQKWLLLAVAAVMLAVPVAIHLLRSQARRAELPVLGQLAPWQLIDQRGEAFGSSQLANKTYVTSFFFTSCPSICPRIMGAMASLQKNSPNVQLVSITVDPKSDTPAVLRRSMSDYAADEARWTFCTGTDEAIREVIVGGFKTYVGKKISEDAGVYDIAHGARLVLVDGKGQVRGHFGTQEEGLSKLLAAIEILR